MAEGPFEIEYAPEAIVDVESCRSFDQAKIFEKATSHLAHEPTKESRSRIKKIVQPFWCEYRLRIDDFRVYYDVDLEKRIVNVLRVLYKGQQATCEDPANEAD